MPPLPRVLSTRVCERQMHHESISIRRVIQLTILTVGVRDQCFASTHADSRGTCLPQACTPRPPDTLDAAIYHTPAFTSQVRLFCLFCFCCPRPALTRVKALVRSCNAGHPCYCLLMPFLDAATRPQSLPAFGVLREPY